MSERHGARFAPPIGKPLLRPTSSPSRFATVRRLVTYYVLVVIELSSRKVHIAGITPGPDGPFMMQVGRNLTDQFDGFLRGERFLVVDRDKKFTTEFRDLLEHAGTDVIWLLHRSPNLNAYVERFVLSIKSECLERMIFFSEQSLRRAVAEFIHHYHGERNRQGLGNALLEAEECVGKANQNDANEGAHHCNSLYNTLSGVPRAAGVRPAPRPRAKPGTERFRLECNQAYQVIPSPRSTSTGETFEGSSMRLVKVCVREFKSVLDSNEFGVSDVTCLVGKNEAGKTAILQALYCLHPIVEKDAHFDVTEDFPRLDVEDYEQDVSTGKRRTQNKVIEATFALTDVDMGLAKAAFGANVFNSDAVTLSRGYTNQFCVTVDVNEHAAVKTLVAAANLPAVVKRKAMKQQTFATLQAYLTSSATKQQQAYQDAVNAANAIEDVTQRTSALEKTKSLQESAEARQLRSNIPNVKDGSFGIYIWQQYLKKQLPKFLYFDEYYQMTGQVNVQKLKERQAENKLKNSDHPMLGLLTLARLNLDQLLNPQSTQALKNKLEGASNHLSNKILQYWSQNKHLHVRFDVRPALPGDPAARDERRQHDEPVG